MTTLIEVEWCLARLPSRIPHRAIVVDVKIASAIVHRHVVVAIASDTAELGILIKRVASSGIGNQRKKVLIAQIVNPGPRSLRVSNYIFTMLVIKVSIAFIFHNK